jgi:hypothetical protein
MNSHQLQPFQLKNWKKNKAQKKPIFFDRFLQRGRDSNGSNLQLMRPFFYDRYGFFCFENNIN